MAARQVQRVKCGRAGEEAERSGKEERTGEEGESGTSLSSSLLPREDSQVRKQGGIQNEPVWRRGLADRFARELAACVSPHEPHVTTPGCNIAHLSRHRHLSMDLSESSTCQ
jgi:hypothetical protein